jgi:hypothetical protein
MSVKLDVLSCYKIIKHICGLTDNHLFLFFQHMCLNVIIIYLFEVLPSNIWYSRFEILEANE